MQEPHKDIIDLKKLFYIIKNCIIPIIIFTTIIVILAGYKIYISPHIYTSYTTINFGIIDKKQSSKGMLSEAFTSIENDLNTETKVITSRYILKKLIEEIDFSTHYYKKNKLKKRELYENSPFSVKFIDIKQLDKIKFSLNFITDDKFLLELVQEQNKSKKLYSKIHTFNEKIDLNNTSLIIKKENFEIDAKQYYFSFNNNKNRILSFVKSHLSVRKLSKKSSIIKITYEDTIPKRAKVVVETLSNVYITENLKSRKEEAENSIKFIKDQLSIINKNLKDSESKLEKFKKENNIIDIDISTKLALTKLTEYDNEVSVLELKLNMIEGIEIFLSNNDITSISIESLSFSTSILSSLIISLQEKQLELNSLLTEFTTIHPQIIKLKSQIKNLKNSIKKKIYGIKRSLKNKKNTFKDRVEKYKNILSTLPQKEIKLVNLKRSFTINEKIYSYLLQKQAEMEIVKASTISTIKILDNPIVNKRAIKPKKMLILIVAMILGLGISIFLASIKSFIMNSISNQKDIEVLTDIPVLGLIPKYKKKKEKQLLAYEEAFISLGTTLYFVLSHTKSNIIAITSSRENEEKNSMIIDLAKILTTKTKKALIIDLDMRDAQLHHIAQKEHHKGISDVILDNIELNSVINKINYAYSKNTTRSFYTISAGDNIPKNPSELVMEDKIDEILQLLSKDFDYILINTTPLEKGKDAIVLMEKADLTLLTVKERYTKQNHIEDFNKIITKHNIKTAGIVLYMSR